MKEWRASEGLPGFKD
ncbi:hypothetical protein ACUXZT_04915 [Vibrio parahaemolyticus]